MPLMPCGKPHPVPGKFAFAWTHFLGNATALEVAQEPGDLMRCTHLQQTHQVFLVGRTADIEAVWAYLLGKRFRHGDRAVGNPRYAHNELSQFEGRKNVGTNDVPLGVGVAHPAVGPLPTDRRLTCVDPVQSLTLG